MSKNRFPDPFFFFDEENASIDPSPPGESLCEFFRRLDTQDGGRLRCLLNRCMARFTQARKKNEMRSRLESGADREQAGVFAELLLSEILSAVFPRLDIEPLVGHTDARPDFRAWDLANNPVTVEVTHFMDSSDERHKESLAWNAVVYQLRPLVRPMPAMVACRAIGRPQNKQLTETDRCRALEAIRRSVEHSGREEVRLGHDFKIQFSAHFLPSVEGKDSLVAWEYEFPGGLIDVPGRLHRITQIVHSKTSKYAGISSPLVVAVNCPTTFLWLDEEEELEPLQTFLANSPCDAVWLFENLQPWSIGCCKSHLIEHSAVRDREGLERIRRAQKGPLYEVLGLGAEWNRLVGWDR
ncbi:MAG: hypothetical protein OXI45_07300 [Acidobacteriota bacterium]|nr:hypothetical protein [Acidobacteriota bacterium]